MSDIVKNRVNNITFQFPLKGDDFKNENILAYNVQKFKEENKQELTEYIFRQASCTMKRQKTTLVRVVFYLKKNNSPKEVMIIKQQKICDVNDCYKKVSFINEKFLANKVLWTCEKHKDLLNRTKDKKQKRFYKRLENSKIIFDYETGFLKLKFYKTT